MRASKRDVRLHGALVVRSDDRSSVTGRTLVAAFLAACASVAIPAVSHAPTAPGALPRPPYPRFAGVTFEPSAAAFDPATGRVLVLSDHDTTLVPLRAQLRGARASARRASRPPPAAGGVGGREVRRADAAPVRGLPRGHRLRSPGSQLPPAGPLLLRAGRARRGGGGGRRTTTPSPRRSAPRRGCPGSRSRPSRSIGRGRESSSGSGTSGRATRRRETWCSWCAAPSPTTGSALRRP